MGGGGGGRGWGRSLRVKAESEILFKVVGTWKNLENVPNMNVVMLLRAVL